MKRRIGTVLLAAALLLGLLCLPAGALWVNRELTLGDVDGDGKVTSTDARLTLQFGVDKIGEEDLDVSLADADGDGKVTSTDARLLLQLSVGKIGALPGKPVYAASFSEAETTPNEHPETFAAYTAGNPFVSTMFTADPSARVWKDGRLYVYPSRDIFPARGCDLMDKYHVFSTDNMADWVDHGEIVSSDKVTWSNCDGFMWAPDCIYIEESDTYYFVFPHPLSNDNGDWNACWAMGMAKSVGSPTGPFELMGYIKLDPSLPAQAGTNSQKTGYFDSADYADRTGRDGKPLGLSGYAVGGYSLIDPNFFLDSDGTLYLVYGGGSNCFITKMGADMLTVTEMPKKVSGLTDFHEGAWLFTNPDTGRYYMMYADNNSGHNRLRYAWASKPTGPFYSGDVILDETDCDTSHGSICQYKGNWYLFYHNCCISHQGNLRSICVDQLYFDEFGLIQKVTQTKTGPAAVGAPSQATEPKYTEEGIDPTPYTVSADYGIDACEVAGGAGKNAQFVANMGKAGATATFVGVDGGKGGKALVTLRYSTTGNAITKVSSSGSSGDGYFLILKPTGTDYGTASCLVDLLPGKENTVTFHGGSNFKFTGITVSLLPENAD